MVDGLEVTIKYRGAKYNQVASPATPSSEFAILKKDLAHLRVHSPSQKNVRRANGSFVLHWPNAGTSTKVVGLADSLHQRWFKLCSNDPEALKLRELLSIESITLVQDGVQIRSTAIPRQASQDAPPGTLAKRLGEPLLEIAQPLPPPSVPAKPPPIPPPRVPPTAPRLDRQPPPHLKRRMSGGEDSPTQTRQKLDVAEPQITTPLESMGTQPEQPQPPTSPKAAPRPISPIAGDQIHTSPQPMEVDTDTMTPTPLPHVPTPTASMPPESRAIPMPPSREPGEMTPQRTRTPPAPTTTTSSSGPVSGVGLATRPPPAPPSHFSPRIPDPRPASPYASSSSSGNGDHHAPRQRDRDVNRLMRELWDTRRHLTAMQAREQALLDDLEQLGVRSDTIGSAKWNGVSRDRRDEVMRLETDLKSEKARRVRAERVLDDVERECRAPFVVPALFQAFLSISELSN